VNVINVEPVATTNPLSFTWANLSPNESKVKADVRLPGCNAAVTIKGSLEPSKKEPPTPLEILHNIELCDIHKVRDKLDPPKRLNKNNEDFPNLDDKEN
jgi:hypothetical protein